MNKLLWSPTSRICFILSIFVIIFAASSGYAIGAIFTVNKTADSNDGTCDADCSLREAIRAANAAGGSNTITLPAGTYTLTIAGTGEDAAATGDLDITNGTLTINGAGAGTTFIQAGTNTSNGIDRVFHVTSSSASLNISAVTIRYGRLITNTDGGGIDVDGGALILDNVVISDNSITVPDNGWADGGGIYFYGTTMTLTNVRINSNSLIHNSISGTGGTDGGGVAIGGGTITMTNVTVENNTATSSNGSDCGGGVEISGGTVSMTDVAVSGNTATFGSGGGICNSTGTLTINRATVSVNDAGTDGGGIYNNGTMTMTNVTVSGNESDLGAEPNESGGGIYNNGTLTVNNCTIAYNIAHNSTGDGLFNNGTANLMNTLIANNDDQNCGGTAPLNANYSLSSDTSCSFIGSNNMTNIINPMIGPLANNGGPTQTHALLTGSPAIDIGNNSGVPATDQRGYIRIWNNIVDIGAYEYESQLFVPTMNEWGMIIFIALAGLGAVYFMRKKGRAES